MRLILELLQIYEVRRYKDWYNTIKNHLNYFRYFSLLINAIYLSKYPRKYKTSDCNCSTKSS
jgi:hypothetical protein